MLKIYVIRDRDDKMLFEPLLTYQLCFMQKKERKK